MTPEDTEPPEDQTLSNRTLGLLLAGAALLWFLVGLFWIYTF